MLLRSTSTPFLNSFLSTSSPHPSVGLRRAVSDGHLASLHHPDDDNDDCVTPPKKTTTLHTELSFSIYNKFHVSHQPQENQEQQQQQHNREHSKKQQELPLFLARGLGIDRIASGLFAAGCNGGDGAGTGVSEGGKSGGEMASGRDGDHDDKVLDLDLDMQYKKTVDAEPSNALFLRNYAQFLHQVKGDPKRAEEYYSRAVLADPSDGEIISQYAKLVWELHHDQERSLNYFRKSVQAAPQNSYVLAAYARFLWEIADDFMEGELGFDPAHEQSGEPVQQKELSSATV